MRSTHETFFLCPGAVLAECDGIEAIVGESGEIEVWAADGDLLCRAEETWSVDLYDHAEALVTFYADLIDDDA